MLSRWLRILLRKIYPDLLQLDKLKRINGLDSVFQQSSRSEKSTIVVPYRIFSSQISSYTYISRNSIINHATIAKFCSIGPNFFCGWGIHPIHGVSTSPMFYSTERQNGFCLTSKNKVDEVKEITIGNDVFIGANVTVLDGVKIGDGAVIGAGAVVSKDIPEYAVAVGNPIKIIKYRFPELEIKQLNKIKWWEWPEDRLPLIEKHFFEIEKFIEKAKSEITK